MLGSSLPFSHPRLQASAENRRLFARRLLLRHAADEFGSRHFQCILRCEASEEVQRTRN